jgi:calcium-dependent protein kinase
LKRLDHPNVIKLYEMYEDEKRYYLVTELCTGGELFDEITIRGQFEEEHAAIIIQQVISAVAYCHRQNLVHRDLKPENILLDQKKSLNVKLTDFGGSAIY